MNKPQSKLLIFTIEYRVESNDLLDGSADGILEKLRETGSADVIDVRIEAVQERKVAGK